MAEEIDGVVIDSEETLRRIVRAMKYTENIQRSPTPYTGTVPDRPGAQTPSGLNLVVVTISPNGSGEVVPDADGFYIGYLVTRNVDLNPTSDYADWYSPSTNSYYDEVRVQGLNYETLDEDVRYLGYVAGELRYGLSPGFALVIVTVGGSGGGSNFPVQLTSLFSSSTAYNWQKLELNTSTASYALSSPPVTGNKLVDVGNDIYFTIGRRGIASPDPDHSGWFMFHVWPLPLVQEVCPIVVSGVLEGFEVQRVTDDTGKATCVDNPLDCCVPLSICPTPFGCPNPIPTVLYATLVSSNDCICSSLSCAGDLSSLLSNFTLTYSDTDNQWVGVNGNNLPGVQFTIPCTNNLVDAFAELEVNCSNLWGCLVQTFNFTIINCNPFCATITFNVSSWSCSGTGSPSVTCTEGTLVYNISATGAICSEEMEVLFKKFDSSKKQTKISLPCVYLEEDLGKTVPCETCTGNVNLKLFGCKIYGDCTLKTKVEGHACCNGCDRYIAKRDNLMQIENPPIAIKSPGPVDKRIEGMISPRDRRNVWRGGVLQIRVTRACDRTCFDCTQGSNLAGSPEHITVDQFEDAIKSLCSADGIPAYFGVVGIFGGNPCIHPRFGELCEILRQYIPYGQRGLWSNHPLNKGKICRITFNPVVSNLNVHQSQEAWDEFARDWPECKPYLKGLEQDSRHTPLWVAMKDLNELPVFDKKNNVIGTMPNTEDNRYELIRNCDINKNWSALIGVFRGQLRGWFCEIAGAQSMLHQYDLSYPDTGHEIVPGWWNRSIDAFTDQIEKHCHDCGIPLKGHGALANDENGTEQVSVTHQDIYKLKRPNRKLEVVTELIQLGAPLKRATDYLENGAIE